MQRFRAEQPGLSRRPVVLSADQRGGRCVVACCDAAVRQGVVPGMPLAEAQGLWGVVRRTSGPPVFAEHDPGRDDAVLRNVAVTCQRFSSIVGLKGTDTLVLDVSGVAHLFGGEEHLVEEFTRCLGEAGFQTRAALADTLGAAWGVAHWGTEGPDIIPPGETAQALGGMPVAALRLSAPVLTTLDTLGLQRIEQLRALPRSSWRARFGPEPAARLAQALGELAEPITPVRAPEPIVAGWDFEYPTADRVTLEQVLQRLLEQVLARLDASSQGVQQLEVRFREEAGAEVRLPVGTVRPSASSAHLLELIRVRLEQVQLPSEVARVELHVAVAGRLERQARSLFTVEETTGGLAWARLLDRLSSRLGKQRVVRPRLLPEFQPECAVDWEACLDRAVSESPPAAVGGAALFRPLRLHTPPRPVEVAALVPEGPPLRLAWGRDRHTIVRWWGPERIETGWWRSRQVGRDYYRVETDHGRRYWLFRPVGQTDWFLHGEFE